MDKKENLSSKENLQEKDWETTGYLTKEVLNFKEALVLLGISSSMLYKLTHKRTIPYYKPNGKLIYFKKSELLKWMLGNRISTTEEESDKMFNQLKKKNYA